MKLVSVSAVEYSSAMATMVYTTAQQHPFLFYICAALQ